MSDYRGIPTVVCPCGNDMVLITAHFDPETYELDFYNLTGNCLECDAILTVGTPADVPERIY